MKVLVEEYGAIIVSSIIGISFMILGAEMLDMLRPFINTYVLSLM